MRTTTLLVLVALAAGCASWEATREDYVLEVNELLHHQYAWTLRDGDAAAFAALFSPSASAAGRAEAERLLAGFEAVEHASCVIEEVRPDDDAKDVRVVLRLDGRTPDGRRRTVEERHDLRLERGPEGWRIAAVAARSGEDWRSEGPAFAEVARSIGIDVVPTCRGVVDRDGQEQIYLAGSGLTLADVDGDGDDDLIVVGGGELFCHVNDGGRFTEEARSRGLVAPDVGECRFAIAGDLENDGDVDLFLGVLDGDNQVYRNDGTGRFERVRADDLGIESRGESTCAALADLDGDGDLDLYVANGGNLLRRAPDPVWSATNATADQYLVNRGDGTFEDRTEAAGFGWEGWALAVAVGDVDGDGDLDLFVANDFGLDRLYRNEGDGTFEDVSDEAGIVHHGASMGASFGDVDNDGDLDLFVAAMASNWRWALFQPGFPAPAPWPISWIFRSQVLEIFGQMMHGNRFYLNEGDGTFVEVSAESDTYHSGWAWGPLFLDYDNDGWLDVYVLNGYLTGEVADDL